MRACSSCGREIDGDFAFCPHCGAELGAATAARAQRKIVTVLFCDVTGSTSLGESVDPEALRGLLARYFERMKGIVERHGGSVEKFIGDAVMAVFGVPVAHEDDALRAVRAAVEMREALPELGLQARIGLNTGEVVAGTVERLATGDAVNVAARLEQAAQPGEVLIGEPTLALVRDTAEVEPLEPLELKGKAEPVPAYRLLRVREVPERRHGTLFVGRQRELATVREAWKRAQTEQRCEIVTLVGEAGVGKSRLVAESFRGLEATVVRGRCLPYGEGITYWPVVEVLKQLDVQPADEAAAVAIGSLLGESDATTSAEEIAWAFRKTLELAAAERLLVVVFDDIQWGEETFLDLIEHVALLSSGAAILLICIARPELTDRRPAWPVTLRLEPLDDEDVDELIAERIPGNLRKRIARAAGGNPLFVEEMLAMAEEAHGEVVVPPTLHALLAARLDQLETAERSVLERGAIEGEIFHRGAVQALAPEETQVTPRLAALVRKELIRPDRAQLQGEDGFRFRHLLIRDVAYDALPKAVRADLHARFASWLEEHGTDLVELDEILGYHLERAYRCRTELAPLDAHARALAGQAADRLAPAGRRAFGRGDMPAASALLGRAAALLESEPERRLELLPELGKTRRFAGDRVGAEAALREAVTEAAVAANRRVEMLARVEQMFLRLYTDPGVEMGDVLVLAEEAIGVFTQLGHDRGLAQAWALVGHVNWLLCRGARMEEAFSRALAHMRRSDEKSEWGEILRMLALVYWAGPMPVDRAIEKCKGVLRLGEGYGAVEVSTRAKIAALEAMRGRFDVARGLYRRSKEIGEELGLRLQLAGVGNYSGAIEMLAGDLDAAERELRAACGIFEALGETATLSTSAAFLARTLEVEGRLDEAERFTTLSAETASADDLASQFIWRGVRARVLARRGELERAELLAREAVALAATTDFLSLRGETLLDIAEVLRLGGDDTASASAVEEALKLFEAKGNIVLAQRAQALLENLALEKRPA